MKTVKKKAKDIHEYAAWLADYINDLPDKCPHKNMIKLCKDIIETQFEKAEIMKELIDNQTKVINAQTKIINAQTEFTC
jgi:uncharacterized coiled-coil DUF342 family protein